jgi:hypothetical protein
VDLDRVAVVGRAEVLDPDRARLADVDRRAVDRRAVDRAVAGGDLRRADPITMLDYEGSPVVTYWQAAPVGSTTRPFETQR